jgi:hypothetical protein
MNMAEASAVLRETNAFIAARPARYFCNSGQVSDDLIQLEEDSFASVIFPTIGG